MKNALSPSMPTGTTDWHGLTKREYVAVEAMSALIKVYSQSYELLADVWGWLFLGPSLWINTEELSMSKVSREKEQPSLLIYPLSMTPSYHRKKRSSTGF